MKVKLCLSLIIFSIVSIGQCESSAQSCPPIQTPVTLQKVLSKIDDCNIEHVEELLPLLPADFRSRYLFVYASRSLQGATPEFPRVILFGLDAKVILAFAGSPGLHGYDLLEMIEYDESKKMFRFKSITFPADNSLSSADASKKAVISEDNPRRCMMCHRETLRPNWDTYAAWPGVYGSRNDDMPPPEKAHYTKFKENVFMKTGRYRFFEDPDKYPDNAWYYDYYRWPRPNLQFNLLLSLLNSQANAREIKNDPKLYPFRYALLASLTCKDDYEVPEVLEELIPHEMTLRFEKSYRNITQDVIKSIEASYAERDRRQSILLSSLNRSGSFNEAIKFPRKEMEHAYTTSRFRYVMELAGVPFREWSMEFGSKNYVFFAGPVGEIGELGLFLWKELLDPIRDRELYQTYMDAWQNRDEWVKMPFSNGTDDLCKGLRLKSREALSTSKLPSLSRNQD